MDQQALKYWFEGKLAEEVDLPPFCGVVAWAGAYKFEILSTGFPTDEEYLYIIFECPKAEVKSFSKKGPFFKELFQQTAGLLLIMLEIQLRKIYLFYGSGAS